MMFNDDVVCHIMMMFHGDSMKSMNSVMTFVAFRHLYDSNFFLKVVANVANSEDIKKAHSLLWDFLEVRYTLPKPAIRDQKINPISTSQALPATRVRRDDVKSWGDPLLAVG